MKKFKCDIILFGFILLSGLLTSCNDYLNKLPDDKTTEAQTFAHYDKVNGLVSDLYNKAANANETLTFFYDFSTAAITDECEGNNAEGNVTNLYNSGAWDASGLPRGDRGEFMASLYGDIRKANLIIYGVKKYYTSDNPLEPGDLNERIGEAYFLRGYLHYLLLRLYGEVPYLDYPVDPNQKMTFKQESADSVAEKICRDAQTAYKLLPASWNGNDFGRVDKGACLGLIAVTRWTMATPLYNGAKKYGYTGKRIFESDYDTYDVNRWKMARDAAKAVLDFKNSDGTPRYSLYTKYTANDFQDSGGQNTSDSTVYTRLWEMYYDMDAFKNEYVWFVTKRKYEGWFGDVYPPSRGGSSRQQPVQEQVDEYEYIAPNGYGYPIYSERAKTDGYDDGNPYFSVKRDPRFYRDILFCGSTFRGHDNNPSTINTATGENAIGASNATTTGYYLRKYLQEGWNHNGSVSISCPPVWRLPEFIYIYCEAVNEISGPNKEIYDLINKVRARSFMAPMPPETITDQNLMREYIKRERRVEFFYEDKRAWWSRLYLEPDNSDELSKEQKWEAAGTTNNERSVNYWSQGYGPYPKCQRMINGMKPIQDPNGKIVIDGTRYKMQRFCVENRVFDTPKMYLWPIMVSELEKNSALVQNPGW
ncbi:membrane protein [Segatella asaccharophila]|jgi:hypothetical protein